jgi:hypothetical protein
MQLPQILGGLQVMLWLISFVFWIKASYDRDYKYNTGGFSLMSKINPFRHRTLYSSQSGYLYYVSAYLLFALGAVCGIIANFIA